MTRAVLTQWTGIQTRAI